MRKQQIEILEDISLIEKRQVLLLEKPKSPQQQLFHLLAQRHLIKIKMIHKNIEQVLTYLPGTFSNTVLKTNHLALCVDSKIELPLANHPLLRMLVEWTEMFPTLKAQREFNLVQSIIPDQASENQINYEEYLSFINFIGADIVKIIRRSVQQPGQQGKKDNYVYNFAQIDMDNLLQFLLISLPKVLLNILLKQQNIPAPLKRKEEIVEVLFKNAAYEYFTKIGNVYPTTMKILIKGVLTQELKPNQQKIFMEIIFRYFCLFHHDKKWNATDFVIQAFNGLSDNVRLSLGDQFILFFRILKKIGKEKFVEFLVQKSTWFREITSKITDRNLIGHAIENVSPFNSGGLGQLITIPSGKTAKRTVEVFKDYSLIYFRIHPSSLDITFRLFYLGEIDSGKATRTMILEQEKISGEYKNSCMAARNGLYEFEFDNSYSWINSKTIKFDTVILTALEYETIDAPTFVPSFYDKIICNQVVDKSKITKIQKLTKKKQKENVQEKTQNKIQGQGNVTKNGHFFNLKIKTAKKLYEFQSDSEDKFVKKFNQIIKTSQNIKWFVAGQPLEEPNNIESILASQNKSKSTEKNEKQVKNNNRQQISQKFEEETQETELKQEKTVVNSKEQSERPTKKEEAEQRKANDE